MFFSDISDRLLVIVTVIAQGNAMEEEGDDSSSSEMRSSRVGGYIQNGSRLE